MKLDKNLALNFFRLKNIEARHFPKKLAGGKKPDFMLFRKDVLFGYCELKSIMDYDFFGERRDSTYNKIQNKIHDASKQFTSSNADHTLPNILFFINHSKKLNYGDLWLVLTGQAMPPNHNSDPIDIRYLRRLSIKGDLLNIDYIIWANLNEDKTCFVVCQRSD
ncbi:MAG: hypothetical protein AABY87_06605 [bacterium]